MKIGLQGAVALAALAGSLGMAGAARADYPSLPGLPNLDFTDTARAPKGSFPSVDPAGWTGGTGLIFVDSQDFANSAAGPIYLTTYGNPVGSVKGNYVEADGNPEFDSGFSYSVTGLTIGQTYKLSFYQGASSQTGFGFNDFVGRNTGTTNQWIVSLGTSGLTVSTTGGPVDPLYGPTGSFSNADATASIARSDLMTVPYQGTVGWQQTTVLLTADATTDLLSFLAWGDNGSTVNLPPIAFLAGVDAPPGEGVPEPATLALFAAGAAGLGALRFGLRRGKRA